MKLKWYDWLVITSVILFMSAHLCTQFIGAKLADFTEEGEQAEALVAVMEQNPLAAQIVNLNKLAYIFAMIVVPGFILSFYVTLRRTFKDTHPYIVQNVAYFFFFVAWMDIMNDLALLAGLMLR